MALKSTVAAALLFAAAVSADCSNKLAVSYPPPEAAQGWSFQLVTNGFTKPRGIQFDKDGGLLVVDAGAGLVHLSLKDEGGTCVSVDKKTTLIASKELNHGIALTDDGKTLYASSAENVYAWTYDSSAVKLSDTNRTVVTNMSTSDHTTRTLLLSKKKTGTLLVSRGSQSNEDGDAELLDSGHSQIRSFDLSSLDTSAKPYNFLEGHVIGWGLRNSVGVAEHPSSGGLWSVENSVDQLHRKGRDIHEDNPAEELNYHGSLSDTKNQGGNYGYPVCYAIWNTTNFPDLGTLTTASQFPDDDALGNVTDAACNDEYVAPRLAFQAHTAPLDVKFDADGATAYVSFHGSWNRDAPVGYRIASVAFGSDGQPTAARNSMDAAVDVLVTKDLSNCPDKCFRPVGLAWDAKGRLWFSSDSTGEIFVMQHNGTSGGGKDGKSAASRGVPGFAAVAVAVAALLL